MAGTTLTLTRLWMGIATDQTDAPYSFNNMQEDKTLDNNAAFFLPFGRAYPVAEYGQTRREEYDASILCLSSTSDQANLIALHKAGVTLCIRDQFGNKTFGTFGQLSGSGNQGQLNVVYGNYSPGYGALISFNFMRLDYSEAVSGI